MQRLDWWVVVSGLLALLLSAAWGPGLQRWPELGWTLLSGIYLFPFLPALLLWFLLWSVWYRNRKRTFPAAVFALSCLVALPAPALLVRRSLQSREWRGMHEYCTSTIPVLEKYRAVHGQYPSSREELLVIQPAPALFVEYGLYRVEGDHYSIGYRSPLLPNGDGTMYDSEVRGWYSW